MQRRDFLKSIGVGALALSAQPAQAFFQSFDATSAAQGVDPVWHVLNRVTYGPRPGQVDAVTQMGLQTYLEQQLNADQIDDSAAEARLGDLASLNLSVPEALYLLNDGPAINELNAATVTRAMYSERQLFEVMADFWSEHFSIWHNKEKDTVLKTADDKNVVRKYALGKFRDILGASARSPAMLVYLDNAKSDKKHPNENYGREIMELHTITVGNYTENDVKEVSRCFTGWAMQGGVGDFLYRPELHDDGEKTVLGQTIAAGGGIKDGETVLDMLAAHPGTALHVSSKLCRRFIGDDPPTNVVKAAQQAFLQSGGDIKTVLRVIFASPEFMSAPPKFKRPWEYVVSLFRATDAQATDRFQAGALNALRTLGQIPFDHITPDGYTDYAALWEGNMLPRWNIALNLVYNKTQAVKVDIPGLLKKNGVPTDTQAIISYFARHLYGRALTQDESTALMAFVNKGGAPDLSKLAGQNRILDGIGMLLAGPAFQWR